MGLSRAAALLSSPAPRLTGETVYLRAPRGDDFSAWAALRRDSREFLKPWEPAWSLDHLDRSAFRRRLKRYAEESAAGRAHAFFLFTEIFGEERLVGGVTVSGVKRGAAQCATLGYWIGEPYQRRGYMTDALDLVTRHAFDVLGLHRMEAACLPDNAASRGLLEKCGFREEGLCRGYIKIAGVWRDHVLYARLAEDRPEGEA